MVDIMPTALKDDVNSLDKRLASIENKPCILAVNIGNEWNLNKLWKNWGDSLEEDEILDKVINFIGNTSKKIHERHPDLLITSVFSNMPPSFVVSDKRLKDIDLWGGNIYPGGRNLTNMELAWPDQFKGKPPKSWFLAEYGDDQVKQVRSDFPGVYNLTCQANVVKGQTQTLVEASHKGLNLVGGFIFSGWPEQKCSGEVPEIGIFCGVCIPPDKNLKTGMGPGSLECEDTCWNENHFNIWDDHKYRPWDPDKAMTPAAREVQKIYNPSAYRKWLAV